MADGRHFENSFISISQSELSDFDQIWYADANFHSQYGYLTKIEIFQISSFLILDHEIAFLVHSGCYILQFSCRLYAQNPAIYM